MGADDGGGTGMTAYAGMDSLLRSQIIQTYVDYVRYHIQYVKKAWGILKVALQNHNVIYDDFLFWAIDGMIASHDSSKFSQEEFIPYADWFYGPYGCKYEMLADAEHLSDHKECFSRFNSAREHHKANNPHHWQNWTKRGETFPNETACHIVCMVADWMAMSMVKGGTAEEYYAKLRNQMALPDWADTFLAEIFIALRNFGAVK